MADLKYNLFSNETMFYGIRNRDRTYASEEELNLNSDIAKDIAEVTAVYWSCRLNETLKNFLQTKEEKIECYKGKFKNPFKGSIDEDLGHNIVMFRKYSNNMVVKSNPLVKKLFDQLGFARDSMIIYSSKLGSLEKESINYSNYIENIKYYKEIYGEKLIDEIPTQNYYPYLAQRFVENIEPILNFFDTEDGLEKTHIEIIKKLGDNPLDMYFPRIYDGLVNNYMLDHLLPNSYNIDSKNSSCIISKDCENFSNFYELNEEITNLRDKLSLENIPKIRELYLLLETLIKTLPDKEQKILSSAQYLKRWDLERTLFNTKYENML